ncbi:hypothetical protein F4859DRAFT_267861 [Xylaria cf. heliscus]|nr:hypothetical protein F4859DRAFT_267861 [Xylaria cf. heliscus]
MTATFTPPLAALTTIFTPPCPITWLLTTTKVPSQFPPFPTTAPASCDPPSWDKYVADRGFEYYSPAICPSGFSVGQSCIITNPRTAQGFPAIQAGETAAYCVPTGHTCTSDTSDFRGGVWGVLRTAAATGAQVTVGPAIQIRWRDEDLNGLETDPLTPGARTTSTESLPVQTTESEVTTTSTPEPETTSTEETLILSTSFSIGFTMPIDPITGGFTTLPSKSTSTSTSTTPSPSSSSSSLSSSSSSSRSPSLSPPPTQETQTPRVLSPSATPSSGQGGNSTDAPSAAQQDAGAKNSSETKSPSSNFTIAATVLTTILISLIAGYGTYSALRQYRRYRAGETKEFFVFTMEEWVRRRVFLFRDRRRKRSKNTTGEDDEDDEKAEARRRWKVPDAELGTEGPVPELGDTKAVGTMENPAELDSPPPPPLPLPPTAHDRWSWRSRVSRILTVRTAKHGSEASGS